MKSLFAAISLCALIVTPCWGAEQQHRDKGSRILPADKNASEDVRAILEFVTHLSRRSEKKLMTGQFLGWHPHVTMKAAEEVHQQSGQWVAVIGVDYYETKLTDAKLTDPEFWKPPRWQENNPLIKDYWSKSGLATISVHMTNPYTGGKAWDTRKRASADLLDPTSEAGRAYLEQLDGIADGIEDLQKEGVVVLYRPFHEWANHSAFWWCKLEPELARKLWRHMFHHFTVNRGLHNIIWVYNGTMKRYPGDGFVDINSVDCYRNYGERLPRAYNNMKAAGKPFAVGEFGPPGPSLDPDTPRNYDYAPFAKMTIDAAPRTVFFLAWRDAWGLHRNYGTTELMNDPLVVNRDDLAAELFPKLRKPPSGAESQGTGR